MYSCKLKNKRNYVIPILKMLYTKDENVFYI